MTNWSQRELVELLAAPEHASSQFLARAATKARAESLAALYSGLGFAVPVLHSGLGPTRQREIIDGLRDGTHRGVAMVGMLIEGFDLPSLRIAAYHDKHNRLNRRRSSLVDLPTCTQTILKSPRW